MELRAVQLLMDGLSDKLIAAAMKRSKWDVIKHLEIVTRIRQFHDHMDQGDTSITLPPLI